MMLDPEVPLCPQKLGIPREAVEPEDAREAEGGLAERAAVAVIESVAASASKQLAEPIPVQADLYTGDDAAPDGNDAAIAALHEDNDEVKMPPVHSRALPPVHKSRFVSLMSPSPPTCYWLHPLQYSPPPWSQFWGA